MKGVDRNSRENLDDDGDGIRNKDDACPNQAVTNYWDDTNGDGCLDDDDGDGIPNTEDMSGRDNHTMGHKPRRLFGR